jgi:DNA-binding transcriptional LysR family regulator
LLNLTHLRSFVFVAEELSFRKAAQRLHLTQPALTRQVQLLEESLGAELLARTRRAVHLTSAGALLLDEARSLLAQVERVEEKIGQRMGNSGKILIGVSMHLAENIHCVGIQHLKRFPNVNLSYREIPSTDQSKALQSCEIDVGFLRPPVNPAYIVSEPLFSQPLVVVLPQKHPLSHLKKVKLSQLADETLFLRPRKNGTGLHDKVLSLYRKAGITPRVIHSTISVENVGGMHIASGNGIFILSAKSAVLSKDLAAVRLDEPDAIREVHIAWRKGERSLHILQFVETARSVFQAKVARKSKVHPVQAAVQSDR